MSIAVGATMDCDGNVVVHVTNDGAAFHGQSATAGSWIVKLDLTPGQSVSLTAQVKTQKSLDGFVQGHYDGDLTFVNVPWHAERACAVPVTTTPVDTTPRPIEAMPGQCNQPGSNPPLAVPCDDPRATTPYVPPTPPTTAVEPPVETTPATVAAVAPVPVPAHTGPSRTHAVVQAKPTQLPVTGGHETVGVLGGGALALGLVLVYVTRRRPRVS